MSGATAEVRRNKKAACPFGVATLGMFVPVLTATAKRSNWSLEIIPSVNALANSLM
jgi:hypothetical protein